MRNAAASVDAPHPLRRAVAAIAIAAACCLGVVGLEVATAAAAQPATVPDTDPPPTTPVTVTTPDSVPSGGGGDDSSDTPWPLIIAVIAVGILVIALLATAVGRRRPAPQATSGGVPPHANVADQDRGYALGAAQWVHDQFSLELLSAQPAQAAQRWNTDRGRIDDAAIRAQRFSAEPDGLTWQRLGQSLSLLSTSLDSYVRLRNSPQPDEQAIGEARAVVNVHRAELAQQLAELWPTVQR